MATQDLTEKPGVASRAVEVIKEYAIVAYPLMVGISLLLFGLVLQGTSNEVKAGVAGATGLIVCAIAVVIYAIFWLLGRFGH